MGEREQLERRLDRLEQRMDEQFGHLMRSMDQFVHMVAENNRALAELRTEMSAMEARLSNRLIRVEEQLKRDAALRESESRHFAHAIGEPQRDVAVLKER